MAMAVVIWLSYIAHKVFVFLVYILNYLAFTVHMHATFIFWNHISFHNYNTIVAFISPFKLLQK